MTFFWSGVDHIDQFGLNEKALREISDWGDEFLNINSASWVGPNRHHDAGDERFHPDNILISSRTQAFMGIIDRTTGDLVWRLGPSFETEAERAMEPFVGPHQVHIVPEGLPGAGNLIMFDNGFVAGYGGSDLNYALGEPHHRPRRASRRPGATATSGTGPGCSRSTP